jgi:feruloyl-CoA synthase
MTSALEPVVLSSAVPLGFVPPRVLDDLVRWAAERSDAVFLAERGGTDWRTLTYRDALRRVRRVAAGILAHDGSPKRPVAIVADNGIDHAVVAHAAMYCGVPASPLSTVYARADADPQRLRALLDVLSPAFIFVDDESIGARVRASGVAVPVLTGIVELSGGDVARADAAFARVTPDTVAKVLFTSGSTGTPKGVMTTNRMLASNQTMIGQGWPAATVDPVLVDWLPWSHCFGGSHNFGLALRHGGTYYIDAGKPAPGLFETTLTNLREIAPTSYFNVPRGFALLLDALEADAVLGATFFSRVHLLCNAGAALPDALRARLETLVAKYVSDREVAIVSSWGTTETAPLATGCWGQPLPEHDTIGVPMPGVRIKLAPDGDRYEICVKGPNVTPGYWRNATATAAAFDDEGFYRTGDAVALRDAADASRGIDYRGRIAENFKLSSGTWVNVGSLRLALSDAAAPLVEDVVVAGHDTDAIAVLVFFALEHARAVAGLPDAGRAELARHPALRERIRAAFAAHNAAAPGGSTRVARALLLDDAPNRAEGEITDKGSLNQQRALAYRAAAVALMLGPANRDVITLVD